MRVRFRPVVSWPVEFSRSSVWHNPFRAPWNDTLRRLEFELDKLGAGEVVIEAFFAEDEIRLDGWPRANARPVKPGVIVSFDSHVGALRYGTDAFPDYQANLRAIALGLEALRKIDRYGIGKRGEQYQGWRQLETGAAARRGAELIREHGGVTEALKATHPDRGGNADDFRAVMAARGEGRADG